MKKVALRILIALCALTMCLGLFACGDQKGGPEGTYELVSVTFGKENKEYKVGDTLSEDLGGHVVQSKGFTLVINKSSGKDENGNLYGTLTYKRTVVGASSGGGSWEEKDGKVSFSIGAPSANQCECRFNDDGTLVFTEPTLLPGGSIGYNTYTLKKAEE